MKLTHILTRLEEGEDKSYFPLRDTEIECKPDGVPIVGERFNLFGKPKNPLATLRWISTSVVKEIWTENGETRFKTETGSLYSLKCLE